MKSPNDYHKPRKAVLISTSRSGSTFLLNCLDSHPQIGCERSEPLSPSSAWADLKVDRHELMRVLWRRAGYRVAMFKLSYRQLKWVGTDILQTEGVSIIHLHRRNALRVIVSSAINTAAVAGEIDHPTHSFAPVTPVGIRLEPAEVVAALEKYRKDTKIVTKRIRSLGLPFLLLTYDDLVGRDGREVSHLPKETNDLITHFLGVAPTRMFSETKRINPHPLSEIVENWSEVRRAIEASDLAGYLQYES